MARRDPTIALRHMVDHASKAVALTKDKTRDDIDADEVLTLALVRLLEVLGEAASRVPPDVRERHTEIPWSSIVGLRNRLIHGYDTINPDILWRVLADDVPQLLPKIQAALAEELGQEAARDARVD